jgi:NAD(P)H-dependent FMN reductase/ketosteroid isomerase-like protein
MPFDVAVIVGSLRAASFSRKIAKGLMANAPPSLQCRIVEIGELALYNSDLETDAPPPAWTAFRQQIRAADAVLFVTPEYNRSLPGGLKNAIDVGSKPDGRNAFAGKPAGVVSVTPYKLGAFGANHALRQTFAFLDMPVMQQPEAYIGEVEGLLQADGAPTDKEAAFLAKFMAAFGKWIAKIHAPAPSDDFAAFLQARDAAALAYVSGNPGPLDEIVTHHDPASFFSPRGDHAEGAATIAQRYRQDAKAFAGPAESRLQILQSHASGDLAFWTGLQHVKAAIGGGEARPMTLRVTEAFRREDGAWKLVHRHADMAKDG